MKRTPLRKKPKPKSLSWWKAWAWKYFSEYIRRRSGGVCFTCGYRAHWKKLQGAHYIPRSLSGFLFFDEVNVQACCTRCNMWLLGNTDEFNRRIIDLYGPEEIERLRRDKGKVKQWNIKELEALGGLYKEKLQGMGEDVTVYE